MPQYCFDSTIRPDGLFVLNPFWAACWLIIFGAVLALLFLKLPGKWKLVPLALVVGLAVLFAIEPIKLQILLHDADEILAGGKWKSPDRRYSLRDSNLRVDAYRIPVASKCGAGFIVEAATSNINIKSAFPSSPREFYRASIGEFLSDKHNKCSSSAKILLGDGWRFERGGACDLSPIALKFYKTSRDDRHWFEMEWCRALDDFRLYCEADDIQVALASGTRF